MGCAIGGQAVIEGVMMKLDENIATSVRLEDGSIKTKKEKMRKVKSFLRAPFVRGVVNLAQMLYLGIKELTWSANQQSEEEEDKLSSKEIFWVIFVSLGLAVLLFIVAPFFLTTLLTSNKSYVFNIIDGALRVVIFVVYILVISKFSDVKVLFQYHGAEHKTINCYEDGKKLTVDNVRRYSTLHPRCGTAFILIVLFISIIVFSLIITESWIARLVSRIVLIPVIAGVSYEILKWSAKYNGNAFVQAIVWPGLMLQKITTKEPDDDQIEVGIKSAQAVLDMKSS